MVSRIYSYQIRMLKKFAGVGKLYTSFQNLNTGGYGVCSNAQAEDFGGVGFDGRQRGLDGW